ncbi:hypothetical protein ABG067_004989 [Albugo candida]
MFKHPMQAAQKSCIYCNFSRISIVVHQNLFKQSALVHSIFILCDILPLNRKVDLLATAKISESGHEVFSDINIGPPLQNLQLACSRLFDRRDHTFDPLAPFAFGL